MKIQGIRIHRVTTYDFGTLGYCTFWNHETNTRELLTDKDGRQIWAAERQKFDSQGNTNVFETTCIPKGNYFMSYLNDEKWRVEDVPNRSGINVEVFNIPYTQSEGCIALGVNPDWNHECWLTVANSRPTIQYLSSKIDKNSIDNGTFQLDIVEESLGNWYGCDGYIGGFASGTYFQKFVKDLRNKDVFQFGKNYGLWAAIGFGMWYISQS